MARPQMEIDAYGYSVKGPRGGGLKLVTLAVEDEVPVYTFRIGDIDVVYVADCSDVRVERFCFQLSDWKLLRKSARWWSDDLVDGVMLPEVFGALPSMPVTPGKVIRSANFFHPNRTCLHFQVQINNVLYISPAYHR